MRNRSGFTVLELSVSLSIIALIIGGIMSGFYIKKRSELVSIMDKITILETAYNNFKSIYNALPGDLYQLPIPTFGAYGSSVMGMSVMYGDGNGIIDSAGIDNPCLPGTNIYEGFISLQHLALANIIPGIYTGFPNSVSGFYKSSVKPTNGYYFSSNSSTPGSNFTVFDSNTNDTRSSLIIYAFITGTNNAATKSAIQPSDLYKIDLKYDDGYPTTGSILGADGSDNFGGCINFSLKTYNVSSSLGCYMGVIIDKKSKI